MWKILLICEINYILEFPPDHLVDNPRIGLYYLDDLGADILVSVVRDWDAVESVAVE